MRFIGKNEKREGLQTPFTEAFYVCENAQDLTVFVSDLKTIRKLYINNRPAAITDYTLVDKTITITGASSQVFMGMPVIVVYNTDSAPIATNLELFHQFCMRRLGEPVIKVNVTVDQAWDRISEAILKYRDFHYDGTEYVQLCLPVTEKVKQDGYFEIAKDVVSISQIYRSGNTNAGAFLSAQYQITSDLVWQMALGMKDGSVPGLTNFVVTRDFLGNFNWLMQPEQAYNFNSRTHRLRLTENTNNWKDQDFIVVQAYREIDMVNSDLLMDPWLIKYATALIKLQWGVNLSKYTGVEMVGGATIDGPRMQEEARAEIQALDEELTNVYSFPVLPRIA